MQWIGYVEFVFFCRSHKGWIQSLTELARQSSFDQALRGEETADPLLSNDWLQQRTVLDELDLVAPAGFWEPPSGSPSGAGPSGQSNGLI